MGAQARSNTSPKSGMVKEAQPRRSITIQNKRVGVFRSTTGTTRAFLPNRSFFNCIDAAVFFATVNRRKNSAGVVRRRSFNEGIRRIVQQAARSKRQSAFAKDTADRSDYTEASAGRLTYAKAGVDKSVNCK